MRCRRLTALLTILAMLAAMPGLTSTAFAVNESNMVSYYGSYDSAKYPRSNASSVFTTSHINIDGVRDDAYSACTPVSVGSVKNKNSDSTSTASGKLYSLWDGTVLYLLVEVEDTTFTLADGGADAMTSKPAFPTNVDSVTLGIDLYNDDMVSETDTIGSFNIDAGGKLHFYRNGGIPSLSAVLADPNHTEYQNRIKSYAAQPTVNGYTVEAAIQIENLGVKNGYVFGVEVQINDVDTVNGKTLIVQNVFWSHKQDGIYSTINDEAPNSTDWGNLTLTGWNGTDDFALSNWRITNTIRFLDSASFPKDVYTASSQRELDSSRAAAEKVINSTNMAEITAVANRLDAAVTSLRWRNTKYPDPDELPHIMTLPNPYEFFQSDRTVESVDDWQKRREEILDLAQFYEYGYKPGTPDKQEITKVEHFNVGDMRTILFWGFWPMTVPVTNPMDVVTMSITDNGKTSKMEFTVNLPTDEQLAKSGHTGEKIPVLLSYDGNNNTYLDAGIAVVEVPAGSGGDMRSNSYAWGTRTGTFYELYPYSRNGNGALKEVSSEMAAAWSATRVIDGLEMLCGGKSPEVAEVIDPSKLAVSGFSINGKYAFVAAVFDDRIGICIPGAAGATGPSPWRYVYTGHEYDFTGTPYAHADGSSGSSTFTAFGTEVMANSVRHNRVRETELFRQFLEPNNFYKRLPGAYGYGTRLPYDQNDLIATLAPRAIVIVNTVNDCNDGSEADALGAEVAKSVYNALGYDADDLVRFNYRGVKNEGDPHGTDQVQYVRNAAYINHYFMDEDMDSATDKWLATDPFALKVSGGKTPFDRYYGGYSTVTGGNSTVKGWYYHDVLPLHTLITISVQPADVYAVVGQQETFSVEAAGKGLSYRWFVDRNDGDGFTYIQGAVAATYQTSDLALENNGYKYKCVLSDEYGQTLETAMAVLHVEAAPPLPKTGDNSMPWIYAAIVLCAATAMAIFIKRKCIKG